DLRAVNVTAEVVKKYIRQRKKDGVVGSTINKETQLLGQAFNLGIKQELLAKGHAPQITRQPESEPREGFFVVGDFEAVVSALPEYLQDFTRFAFLCAWRKGQLSALEWRDVNREAGVIVARPSTVKNRKAHKLVLEGELKEIIER